MDNFPKSLAEVRLYLANLKPWAVIAAVAAMVVVGFYTLQGYRYWSAWDESRMMNAQIDQIQSKLDRGMPGLDTSANDLDLQQQRLSYFEDIFSQRDVSRLIGIVSATSWDSGIELPSISSGDPVYEEVGETKFLTQIINITAEGDTNDIYRFLSDLHSKLPIMSVPNISISRPGPNSTAQIQLTLYLLPDPKDIPEEEAAD